MSPSKTPPAGTGVDDRSPVSRHPRLESYYPLAGKSRGRAENEQAARRAVSLVVLRDLSVRSPLTLIARGWKDLPAPDPKIERPRR